jgi:hypothetical protein
MDEWLDDYMDGWMDRWMDSLPWMKTERADTSRHSDTVISI